MLPPVRERVDCHGVELLVARTGIDRMRPTILFVNAVGMAASLLAKATCWWSDCGFNFVTWELRGSPGGSLRRGDCTLASHTQDGIDIVAHLGLGDVVVGGWCTGASIALALATEMGERTTCMFLIDGAFLFEGVPGASMGNAMYAMCKEIVSDGGKAARFHEITSPRDGAANVPGLGSFPRLAEEVTRPYRQDAEALCRYAWAICAVCAYDPTSACANVKCPTLVTARADDVMVSFRNSVRAAGLMKGATFKLYSTGGHYSLFTGMEGWEDIAGFVRGHRGAREGVGAPVVGAPSPDARP